MSTFLSQIAKITDNLYLSSFVGATEHNVIKFNITCVITVCKEVPKLDLKHVELLRLDVLDKPTESLSRYFDLVADKINDVTNKKGACLIHCVAGISRSATMVLVYLMKYQSLTLKEAHALVKSRRPFIRPNLGFWRQLVEYEYSLFGKNSIKIIPSNIGYIPDIYENEVKSMMWAKSNPNSAGTLAAQNAASTDTNLNFMSSSSSSNNKRSSMNNQQQQQQQQQQQGGTNERRGERGGGKSQLSTYHTHHHHQPKEIVLNEINQQQQQQDSRKSHGTLNHHHHHHMSPQQQQQQQPQNVRHIIPIHHSSSNSNSNSNYFNSINNNNNNNQATSNLYPSDFQIESSRNNKQPTTDNNGPKFSKSMPNGLKQPSLSSSSNMPTVTTNGSSLINDQSYHNHHHHGNNNHQPSSSMMQMMMMNNGNNSSSSYYNTNGIIKNSSSKYQMPFAAHGGAAHQRIIPIAHGIAPEVNGAGRRGANYTTTYRSSYQKPV